MGSAAAYHLARRGEPVLLIEQFALGHDRGSSHGAARITRHSYAEPHYARLMPEAFRAWRVLEADAGQNLYLRTGGVSFCPPGVDYVAQVAASLAAIGVPHRRFSGRELHRALSGLPGPRRHRRRLRARRRHARRRALRGAAGRAGPRARRREDAGARAVPGAPDRPRAGKPTVITDTERIEADRLIVTAGAWTRQLFPRFSTLLRPTRQQVLYFRPAEAAAFEPGRFPVFIYKGADELDDFYGMPAFLGMGVKVARHGGPETDPDVEERSVGDDDRAIVRRFLRGCLPALAEAPIDRTEICLYTVAPDDHFRLDFLPGRRDVIVASPCSGHGFKFSCLIGSILADLATQGQTAVDITPWRLG